VQVEKYQACSTSLLPAATSCGATVAHLHASLFPTRLAMARWMIGGATPHVHSCTRHIARAAWYDQAQDRFQAWLEAGGFHTPEPDNTGSAIQDGAPQARRRGDSSDGNAHCK
jgi:hypothetical protein